MSYKSDTIATVLKRLNDNYFLPVIQREYVWHQDQIIQLFDSIMRSYPVGSFLFWALDQDNHDKWNVYQFVQNYVQDETHNAQANTEGVQQLTLVLDGQQRLTSLLIGLKGTYTVKKKYMKWSDPRTWVKQNLYLNLFKDPKASEDDTEEGIRYEFRFFETPPTSDREHYWFKVGRILNFTTEISFHEFLEQEEDKFPDHVTRFQMRVFKQNLETLYWAIWKEDVIADYIEQDQDYDRVLTIFVRANQGGTKLSKSDLLLSMVTAKWNDMNARDEIYAFVDRLNNSLTHKNNFDKDFIMKTCLVLSDLPVQYKVENFNNTNLMEIRKRWNEIKMAIESTVMLINSFGIDRDTLTSANALIPIIYYFFQHTSMTLQGNTSFEIQNGFRIHRWLLTALLNNAFSGQSDRALNDTRRAVAECAKQGRDFPVEAINAELTRSKRKAAIDDDTIEIILNLLYGKPLTFLALSLLYDNTYWGNLFYHQDHIFPQTLFTQKHMDSLGFSADQQKRYGQLMNRFGNLQLLVSHENLKKSDQDIEQWLASRDLSFRRKHLIPDDNQLLNFDHFEEFIDAREELIRKHLTNVLLTV